MPWNFNSIVKIITPLAAATLFVSWLLESAMISDSLNLPRIPEPQHGRLIPYEVKGNVVYLTSKEKYRLVFLRWVEVSSGLILGATFLSGKVEARRLDRRRKPLRLTRHVPWNPNTAHFVAQAVLSKPPEYFQFKAGIPFTSSSDGSGDFKEASFIEGDKIPFVLKHYPGSKSNKTTIYLDPSIQGQEEIRRVIAAIISDFELTPSDIAWQRQDSSEVSAQSAGNTPSSPDQ